MLMRREMENGEGRERTAVYSEGGGSSGLMIRIKGGACLFKGK